MGSNATFSTINYLDLDDLGVLSVAALEVLEVTDLVALWGFSRLLHSHHVVHLVMFNLNIVVLVLDGDC